MNNPPRQWTMEEMQAEALRFTAQCGGCGALAVPQCAEDPMVVVRLFIQIHAQCRNRPQPSVPTLRSVP